MKIGSAKEEQMKPEENHKTNHRAPNSRTPIIKNETTDDSNKIGGNALANLQELEETVKAMMETSGKMVQVGNRKACAKVCKVCGKEGHPTDIMRHIEAFHLEGVSIHCNFCDKILR